MTAHTVRVRILVAVDSDGEWRAIGNHGRDRAYCENWIGAPDARIVRRYSWIEADVPLPEPETTIAGEVKGDAP